MNLNRLLVTLSFLGLFFLILLYLGAPVREIYHPLILAVFVLFCLGGLGAASYPWYCPGQKSRSGKSTGHHPDCGEFDTHTLQFRGRKYCAGCSGLFLGALVAIGLCTFYYLHGFSSFLLFWAGVITVFISLLQLNFLKIDNAPVKFISNLILVVGSALILLGILEFKPNLSLFFLVLIVLWIYTRTTNSAVDHDQICHQCHDACCPYIRD